MSLAIVTSVDYCILNTREYYFWYNPRIHWIYWNFVICVWFSLVPEQGFRPYIYMQYKKYFRIFYKYVYKAYHFLYVCADDLDAYAPLKSLAPFCRTTPPSLWLPRSSGWAKLVCWIRPANLNSRYRGLTMINPWFIFTGVPVLKGFLSQIVWGCSGGSP